MQNSKAAQEFKGHVAPPVKGPCTARPQDLLQGSPAFLSLQVPGFPPATFPFCGEEGWAYVAEMERGGWQRSYEGANLILTQPVARRVGGRK